MKFFEDTIMNIGFLHTLTFHGFKGAALGECFSVLDKVNDGDAESWRNSWENLAIQVENIACKADKEGHVVSARDAYLRAVSYFKNASLALKPFDPRYRTTVEKYRKLFRRFAELSNPKIEYIEIPFKGEKLPGYFMKSCKSHRPCPTIIIGDNVAEELYYWVGPPAIERGYNAVLVDLPGIGLNYINGIDFIPETEVGVSAVIDYLYGREDVDTKRIAVYGGGEPGGYIMTRASSKEERISACIVDPLVSDIAPVIENFTKNLSLIPKDNQHETLGSILAQSGQIMITVGMKNPQVIARMNCDSGKISCPILCINDSSDYPELQRQTQDALQKATNPLNASVNFKPQDGTSGLRQLDNFEIKHQVMFDWLDDIFKFS